MVLFVYYKFEPGAYVSLPEQLCLLRAELSTSYPNVAMRVMKRPVLSENAVETWMEMYQLLDEDATAFAKLLADTCDRLNMPTGRKTEWFEDVVGL